MLEKHISFGLSNEIRICSKTKTLLHISIPMLPPRTKPWCTGARICGGKERINYQQCFKKWLSENNQNRKYS